MLACMLGLARGARADTVWNVELGDTSLTLITGNPNDVLPACRCVTGVWQVADETATHFVGALDAVSANHARKQMPARVKIRKTRSLMGVHRDYRAALHGILRGNGALVVREVEGSEWEVVGFAREPLHDLFARYARWRADPKRPPKPAKRSPMVDEAADAAALAKLINDYRASIDLPRVAVSAALAKVARAHVHDLETNKPVTNRCNMHSWSKHGAWSACCYDGGPAAARCMWKKPQEIARYRGNGYEIAASASGITPEQALALWQKSPAHHVVMINREPWTKPWRAMGVAIAGDYAVAWFSDGPE